MAITTLLGMAAEHWMLTVLLLCPIVIVAMALAALSCEVCGSPFGVFRRRNRTIDLCLRCALLHDIRQAKETRSGSQPTGADSNPGESVEIVHGSGAMQDMDMEGVGDSTADNPDRRVGALPDRRRAAAPPVELRVAGGSRHQ